MNTLLVGLFIIAIITAGCNDYMVSFSAEAAETLSEPLPPLEPLSVEGVVKDSSGTKVVSDEELDELGIKPDSVIAGLARSFRANPLQSQETSVDFQAVTVDNKLVMTAEMSGESRKFTQIVRPVYSSNFQQTGTHGDAVTENFAQNERGILDILMVIDNSGSMQEAQKNVSERLPALLDYVAESDWRIAITSTDRRDCIRRIITPTTPNYEQVFAKTIMDLGTDGSPAEEAILMAHRGLRGECRRQTKSWLRDDSSVAIIIVSDEDHQCYLELSYRAPDSRPKRKSCRNRRDPESKQLADFYRPIDEFYAYLQRLRVPGKTAKIYGIISLQNGKDKKWLQPGSKWFRRWRSHDGRQLFDRHADIFSDSAAYEMILRNISEDISITLKDQFMLQHVPTTGSVAVKVTDGNTVRVLHSGEYMLQGKTLTLSYPPPQGSTITIDYRHNAKPDVKNFVLPQLPLPGSVVIDISLHGQMVVVDTDAYTRVGREIMFHTAPPKGSLVTINYKENKPLRSKLQLGKGKITTLLVTVDGEEVDTYMLDPVTNLLTFPNDALPPEGAVVEAIYDAIVKENLTYPLARHDALRDGDNLLCFNVDDPLVTASCGWQHIADRDYVVFDAGEFISGRELVVRQFLDIDTNNILLQQHYLADSIRLHIGTHTCYAEQLLIENDTIVLDNYAAQVACPYLHSDAPQQLALKYSHIELRQEFGLDKEFFDTHVHEYEHWTVTVNGEKITDFEVKDYTVVFGYQLPPDAVVEIEVSLY